MKTHKYLKRDIRLGIIQRSYLYIIAIMFSCVTVYQCSTVISGIKDINYMWSDGTVMDYWLFAMRGMAFYRFDPTKSFEIPMLWFIFQIGISYFIAYYAEKDLKDNGLNSMIAGRSREAWWTAKMAWCALSVLIYYVIAFVSCTVVSLIKGASLSMKITDEFTKFFFGYNMTYLSYSDLMLIVVIVPVLVTISICLIQLYLSFVLSPVTSFALISGLYILSAYYTAWFLPGNYTMWLRSSYYIENGVSPLSGLIFALFVVVAVFFLGHDYFRRKDIL